MAAITFTYASLGAYTGGFSSVSTPKKTTGHLYKRISELLKTSGVPTPKYSTCAPVSAVANTFIIWSTLLNKKISITGMRPAMVGAMRKQISQTTSYTGSTIPKFGSYKRVSIYGVYSNLYIRKTTSFGPLPLVGSNQIPFSVISKTTGVDTVSISSVNAKIKLWSTATITPSEGTSQANIQFWS